MDVDPADDKPTPFGRRQIIAIKDADLIVAVGSEIRVTSLEDSKSTRGTSQKSYKVRAVACDARVGLRGSHRFYTLQTYSLRSTKFH